MTTESSRVLQEPIGERPDLRRAYLVLCIIGLTSFQTSMNLSIVFVVFPDLVAEFPKASNAELSWVLSIFAIVGAPTLVFAGAFGERWGRKRTLLLGVALFTLTSVLAALAPSPGWIILARAALAIAASMILPMSATLVLREFPMSHRGVASGTWSAIGGVAAAMGPSVGGILVQLGSWRWAFWLNVPIGVVAFVACWIVVQESRDETATRLPDAIGAIGLMLGIGGAVLGLVQSPDWGWADARTVAAIGGGIVLIGAVLVRSIRHPVPILELNLFRARTYGWGNAGMLTFSVSFFATQFTSVVFLTQVWGYSVRDAGLLATPVFALTALMSPVAGRIADRFGEFILVPVSTAVWSVGVLWLALTLGGERDMTAWFVGISIAGVGSGLSWGGLFSMVLRRMPAERFAMAASISQTLQRIGNALGVAVAVTVLGSRANASRGEPGPFPRVFATAALFGALTAASSIAARTRRRVL
ncbi:MAG TPA: MFS transporter [Acidimicrobiales bacterium]|nr:MFS transporter [Acidimicrobiales bacterium]